MPKTNSFITPNTVAALLVTLILMLWSFFSLQADSLLRENQKLAREVEAVSASLTEMEQQVSVLEISMNRLREENDYLIQEKSVIFREYTSLLENNLLLRSMIVVSHAGRNTKKVAITIDDGAEAALINQALNYFQLYGVKATLFPMGAWVDSEPEAWRRAVDEGHELGNHTYSHRFLTSSTEHQIRAELDRWQDAVDSALGYRYECRYFRPPGMAGFAGRQRSNSVYQGIIAEHGMATVLWDVETVYALRVTNKSYNAVNVGNYVISNARGGSIILLHFVPADIHALPAIIEGLRKKGLEPVTLTELFKPGRERDLLSGDSYFLMAIVPKE